MSKKKKMEIQKTENTLVDDELTYVVEEIDSNFNDKRAITYQVFFTSIKYKYL